MNLEDLLNSLENSKKNIEDIDSNTLDWQIVRMNLQSRRYESDTRDRKWLAKWTAVVVSLWLVLVIAILTLNKTLSLGLSDTVLITLLGTTTLNVLGISFIVLRGHFTSSNNNESINTGL